MLKLENGMVAVKVGLQATSPLIYGGKIVSERIKGETGLEHDKRCWMEKAFVNDEGKFYIPAYAFKQTLLEAAKMMDENYKLDIVDVKDDDGDILDNYYQLMFGKRCRILKDIFLETYGEVQPVEMKSGGDIKFFPSVGGWTATTELLFAGNVFTTGDLKGVVKQVFNIAGIFIGVMAYTPRVNREFGTFEVKTII